MDDIRCPPCKVGQHHDCHQLVLDTGEAWWRCCCWRRVPLQEVAGHGVLGLVPGDRQAD